MNLNNLDRLYGGFEPKETLVHISNNTPKLLQSIGLQDLPLYLPKNKILTGLTSQDNYNHGHKDEIGMRMLPSIFSSLEDPMMVVKDKKNYGIFLKKKASTGRPIYVVIKEEKNRNIIVSIYGRIKFNKEDIIYVDDTFFNKKWDTNMYCLKFFKRDVEDFLYVNKTIPTKTSLRGQL